MIVTDYGDRIIMITQYDHSRLSGSFVPYWKESMFKGLEYLRDVQLAVQEHDRAWINLDENPIWNENTHLPYSFMDYPLKPKIESYRLGIDEVEQMTPYAGYLNSRHFLSFFDKYTTNLVISRFISWEIDRQNCLISKFPNGLTEEKRFFHFNLLQFFDDLSLYICLNKPGVSKEGEHPMFKDGFRQRFEGIHQTMKARWINAREIELNPFPFIKPFKIMIPFKELMKKDINREGLAQQYKDIPLKAREVVIKN